MAQRHGVTARPGRMAALAVVPILFVVATYLWPVTALVMRSARSASGGVVSEVFGSSRTWHLIIVTLLQAIASTIVALVVGVPAAWCHARFRFPGRGAVWSLGAVPFVLPAIVVAAGLRAVLGGDGASTWCWVIAAHAAVNLGVILRTVGARFARIDPGAEEVARVLGRSSLRAAWDVTVLGSLDAIWGAALVVFLFSLTSFGIVLILGGRALGTVEIEIWLQTTRLFRLDVAALLAGAQLVLVIGVLALHSRVAGSRPPSRSTASRLRRPLGRVEWALVIGSAVPVLAATIVPIGGLAARALRVGDGWGLANFAHLSDALAGTGGSVTALGALWWSTIIAVVATVLAVGVGIPASIVVAGGGRLGRTLDGLLMIPLATSAATVGFGFLLAYRTSPFDLRGSAMAVPLVEAAIATPLAVRVLVPAIRGLDASLSEAARTLGSGRRRRFLVAVLPGVRGALLVAAALSFAVSLGEFGATAFLARSGSPTLPQVIQRLLGRPGEVNVGRAMALGLVLSLICGGVFSLAERLGRTRSLEF